MMINILKNIFLQFLIMISFGYPQNKLEMIENDESYYFVGFNFGLTSIQDIYSNEDIINYGITFSKQRWPYLLKIYWQRNAEFTLGGEPKAEKGFISDISEFNLLYSHLIQIPFAKKFYTGLGTGIGIIYLTRNVDYLSEDAAIKDSFIRLGIPFELRLGFLYPSKKIQLLDFIYFFNWNSVDNFRGWKLNFNIGLN